MSKHSLHYEMPVGRGPENTAEKERIKGGIQGNPLFKYLDGEQQDMLATFARLVPFPTNAKIVQEGEIGDTFYIVEKGTVALTQHNAAGEAAAIGNVMPGGSFGEKAMFYDTRRSGGAVAAEDCWIWCVDRTTFHKVLTSSTAKQDVFNKYATVTDKQSGAKIMRPVDFVQSLIPNKDFTGKDEKTIMDEVTKEQPRMSMLLDLVDRNRSGSIDLLEYCLFDVIARKPDPFLDFAFLMFDEEKKGYVNINDVERVLTKKGMTKSDLDLKGTGLSNYFLGEGRLRFLAFSEFYLNLQEEMPRQAFKKFDESNSGRISKGAFLDLVSSFGHWRMPPNIKDKVNSVGGLSSSQEVVTFAEFMAFNNLLNHLPGCIAILRHAKAANGGRAVSKTDFIKSATMMHSVRPSPLEVDIMFSLCDQASDGGITLEAFETLTGVAATPSRAAAAEPQGETASGRSRSFEAVLNFALGSIAGAMGAVAVYPIDFVKTRLQNQPYDAAGKGTMYSGIVDCARKTVLHEGGPLSLYRGLPSQLVGVAPEKAIKLATNDLLRGIFSNDDKPLDLPLEILSGSCAGATQVMFTNPYELVKIRMQIQGAEAARNPSFVPKSMVQVVKEIGLGGLYKGAGACLLRDVPFSAIYFPTYARTKSYFIGSKDSPSKADLLLAGAAAGAPAAYMATPADVIKTRIQADKKGEKPRYTGIADCVSKTLKEEGARTFFVGGGMRVFRSSPQFAITLLVYEVLQKQFAPKAESPRPLVLPAVSSREYTAMSTPLLQKIFPGI